MSQGPQYKHMLGAWKSRPASLLCRALSLCILELQDITRAQVFTRGINEDTTSVAVQYTTFPERHGNEVTLYQVTRH